VSFPVDVLPKRQFRWQLHFLKPFLLSRVVNVFQLLKNKPYLFFTRHSILTTQTSTCSDKTTITNYHKYCIKYNCMAHVHSHYLVGATELLTMIDYQLISVSVFIQRTHIHRPTQSEARRKDPCYLICGSSDDSKATATTPLMHVPCSSNALERSISAQLRSNCLRAFCYKTEHSSTQWS